MNDTADDEDDDALLFRVRFGLGLLRAGFNQASSAADAGHDVKFACVTIAPDGSGCVGATFEAAEFMDDIEALLRRVESQEPEEP